MRLNHNLASLNIFNNYRNALIDQSKALKNISTGSRVNSSGDDPYAAAQDGAFTIQIRGLQMANQNAQDGISLMQTAEGGLSGMTTMLQRIRDLAVQAGNGTNSTQDKMNIQAEIGKLVDGVDNLSQSTNINGVNLLSSTSGTSLSTLIGANVGENIDIPTFNLRSDNLQDASGNKLSQIDVTSPGGSDTALNVVDSALKTVNSARSKYGAIENRLNDSITNMSQLNIQDQTADSSVMDVDEASEMMRYSKDSILSQAGIALMSQTNKFPQEILNILQNVK